MRTLYLALLFPLLLFTEEPPVSPGLPWFTGPLITSSSLVTPGGHYNIEPYLYSVANTGIYQEDWSVQKNSPIFWANSLQISTTVGLLSWLDIQFTPTISYNYTDGVGDWAFGDLPVGFDIQLYKAAPGGWIPNVRLTLKETFPTGKYQKLKASKKGTDAGGNGSFITSFALIFGKLFHIQGVHFFNARLAFQYSLPTSVHLKGLNTYGGTETTDGTFYPAKNAQIATGFEYSLTEHWALALDAVFNWASDSDFTGDAVTDQQLSIAPVGASPLIQYSLAPAIEYSWNAPLGLIAGSWFTIAGKNAVQFFSGIVAVNWYY